MVEISTPIRNLLSVIMTQLTYLKLMRQCLVSTIDFEILHKSLHNCVDKCVVKSSGLTIEDEIIEPDIENAHYSYWIDKAIQIFGDKTKH